MRSGHLSRLLCRAGTDIRTRLTHLLFFIIYGLLRVLPVGLQEKLADFMGRLLVRLSPKHKELMISNLRRAFGDEYSPEEFEDIAVRSMQNLVKSTFEFTRFPLYDEQDIKNMVELEGRENLEKALAHGKGVVLASAHYGNWEAMAAMLSTFVPLTVVGRTQNDSLINDYIVGLRTSKGTKNIPRGVPMYEHITGLLANNEVVGLVSDQNAGPRGLFVDFFGTKVSSFKGPGLFALRTGCKIVPVFIVRRGYQKHTGYICPHIEISPTGDAGRDISAYTQGYTKVIEDFVRRHPDHWFWIHKRWKTPPPGADGG